MKIGILSDSHRKSDYTRQSVEFLKENDAEYLIHAGDLEIEENLNILKQSGLKYMSVFGNNDKALSGVGMKYKIRIEPYHFKIDELKIKLMHMPYYLNHDGADLVIYGHTHIFETDYKDKVLFINPGEACGRESGEIQFVLLEILDKEYIINFYHKKINEKDFKKTEIRYDK